MREAETIFKLDLAITEKAQGPQHPDAARSLNNLAGLYYTQGKYEQAEPLLKRALAIYEKQLGPEHPDTVTIRNNAAQSNLLQLYTQMNIFSDSEDEDSLEATGGMSKNISERRSSYPPSTSINPNCLVYNTLPQRYNN